MKIAICDDMELYRKDIIDAIDSKKLLGDFVEYTEFDSAEALLVAYETTKYDVVFLDVEMAKLNGIDAGIQIRNKNNKTIIIFVSSYPHYSIPAYECEPLYYLTKPFKNNDLTKVFNKIANKYQQSHQTFTIRNKHHVITLPIEDILYVDVYRKTLTFHTKTKKYNTTGTIAETLAKLGTRNFCQIHQSYIVNMNYIIEFNEDDVVLTDDFWVTMSKRKRSSALSAYTRFLEEK